MEENLVLGRYRFRKDRRADRAGLEEVDETFPVLADHRDRLGGGLSGGEQQTLAIGRALMARPRLLMLDEPSLELARDGRGVLSGTSAELQDDERVREIYMGVR